MTRLPIIVLIALIWPAYASQASAASVVCTSIRASFEAMSDGEPEPLRALFVEARDLSDCGARTLGELQDAVADAFVERAERLLATGAGPEAIEHDFRQSLVFRKDWRIYERLGDVASDIDEYVSASLSYMYAVHTIGNADATVNAPEAAEMERVLRKFSAVWSVADFYERPLPILFGGSWARAWHRELVWATALGVDALRGYRVSEPMLPVTFKFASPVLTRHGEEALVVMSQMLGRLGSPEIRLAGRAGVHELENNAGLDLDSLARARAETVQAWFESRNYGGRVLIEDGPRREAASPALGVALPERVALAFERRVDYGWEGGPQLPGGALSR